MKLKFLKDVNVKDKVVLLRADLNSDVVKGKLVSGERIEAASETVRYLKKNGAKVIVIAHQGNPKKPDFISLKSHARALSRYTKVSFCEDIYSEKTEKKIRSLKSGEALLLENIRFEKDEFDPHKKNNKLIIFLTPLIDLYVNDAFSVCHRKHTSIVSFPKYVPSYGGLLLEREVNAVKKINTKNALFILGGAKPESNVKLLGKNRVLATGLFSQACLIAKGCDFGFQNKFLRDNALMKDGKTFLSSLKRKLKNILLPVDFAIDKKGKRVNMGLEDFPSEYPAFDIGNETIESFKKEIAKAKVVYMKGPAGYTGDKNFQKGTFELLRAIAGSKAYSIIGGGHVSDSIRESKISRKKFSHVSLSGGALLNLIAGEKLPGLTALGYYKR